MWCYFRRVNPAGLDSAHRERVGRRAKILCLHAESGMDQSVSDRNGPIGIDGHGHGDSRLRPGQGDDHRTLNDQCRIGF